MYKEKKKIIIITNVLGEYIIHQAYIQNLVNNVQGNDI